jgi:hypothetical protein
MRCGNKDGPDYQTTLRLKGCAHASSSCVVRKVVIHMLRMITLVYVDHMKTNMNKKAREHMNFRAHTRNTAISTDKNVLSDSSHDQIDYSFA